jgi:selenide,water dikinase
LNAVPGGTHRNWKSYGHKVGEISDSIKHILADPQTSGGLLIAVDPTEAYKVEELLKGHVEEEMIKPIGKCILQNDQLHRVSVR